MPSRNKSPPTKRQILGRGKFCLSNKKLASFFIFLKAGAGRSEASKENKGGGYYTSSWHLIQDEFCFVMIKAYPEMGWAFKNFSNE
jgi:hypothetical protein